MKRILHQTVKIVTFVDPITQEPYGNIGLRYGKPYRNLERAAKKADREKRHEERRCRRDCRRAAKRAELSAI